MSREDGSAARIFFEERVMGEARVALTAVVMPTSADVAEVVARNPAAIGYASRADVVEWIEPVVDATAAGAALSAVKVLAVEGVAPTTAAIKEQRYALTQPLYLITRGEPQGRVRQFVDFVLSPAGQAIVGRYHAPIR